MKSASVQIDFGSITVEVHGPQVTLVVEQYLAFLEAHLTRHEAASLAKMIASLVGEEPKP